MKLICLPYAGGTSGLFNKLNEYLDNNISLLPIDYPGHGTRLCEPMINDIDALLNDIAVHINNEVNSESYVLLGYSMGAILAYELIKRNLLKNNPVHLILAANGPPHYPIYARKTNSQLTESEWKDKLIEFGGIDVNERYNDRLLKLFLPIVKKDLILLENFLLSKPDIVVCNINATIFYSDLEKTNSQIEAWDDCFVNNCDYYYMGKEHFFIRDNTESFAKIINLIMKKSSI